MRVDFRSTLAIQRALDDLPRSPARFQAYLCALDPDPVTRWPRLPPLVAFNPMGRDHVATHLNALPPAHVARQPHEDTRPHPRPAPTRRSPP